MSANYLKKIVFVLYYQENFYTDLKKIVDEIIRVHYVRCFDK